jgi:hypothetical protein
MSLIDWLAEKVAGPKGFGQALGRTAAEAAAGLGNALFLSHGTGASDKGPPVIFDESSEMEAAGFRPCFKESVRIDLSLLTPEQQSLLRGLHTALYSYAFLVVSNAALRAMKKDCASQFINGLASSIADSMTKCRIFDTREAARTALLSNMRSYKSSSGGEVINLEKPGSEDVLGHFINRAIDISGSATRYAFVRNGELGFGVMAMTLVELTLKAVDDATEAFKW